MSKSIETKYFGRRNSYGAMVFVTDAEGTSTLSQRQDLFNHSPTGLEWGYGGSGPAQLALAILADYLGDDQRAVMLHQDFKWHIISSLPREKWELTGQDIDAALSEMTAKQAKAESLATKGKE